MVNILPFLSFAMIPCEAILAFLSSSELLPSPTLIALIFIFELCFFLQSQIDEPEFKYSMQCNSHSEYSSTNEVVAI